jgi:hypothetical protein
VLSVFDLFVEFKVFAVFDCRAFRVVDVNACTDLSLDLVTPSFIAVGRLVFLMIELETRRASTALEFTGEGTLRWVARVRLQEFASLPGTRLADLVPPRYGLDTIADSTRESNNG